MRLPRRLSLTTSLVVITMTLSALILSAVSVFMVLSARVGLMDQLDQSVHEAAQRGAAFARGETTLTGPGPVGSSDTKSPKNPLDAPGQQAEVLTVLVSVGILAEASYRNTEGTEVALSDADLATIRKSGALSRPTTAAHPRTTVQLSMGEYRLETAAMAGNDVLVTGLPTMSVHRATTRLAIAGVIGSVSALALAGLVGTLLIRRELRPLERISRVAEDVAALPLESSSAELDSERVPDQLAKPGTEVGNVGVALNKMLDTVETAFSARERSEQRLRTFLADASHELRTPMTAIRGYTDMIKLTEPLTDDGKMLLSRVESQSVRISSLIDDMLTLARLDEGRPTARVPVLLNELVLESVLDASASGPGHVWDCDLDDEDIWVQGDRLQLTQVMSNLLSNARKHTQPGTRVTAALTTSGPKAVLTVSDNGPGIPEAFLGSVFDRFARADSSRTASEPSTGLGMSIAQGIVAAHDGTIEVASSEIGTQFTVTLPLAPASEI